MVPQPDVFIVEAGRCQVVETGAECIVKAAEKLQVWSASFSRPHSQFSPDLLRSPNDWRAPSRFLGTRNSCVRWLRAKSSEEASHGGRVACYYSDYSS